MPLIDKVVLVTGASRGIGAACLQSFKSSGAVLIGTATSEAGAEKITQAIQAMGASGRGMVLNVADDASIETFFTALKADYAMPSVLVNNAAVTRDNILMRMKADEWQSVIDTNLSGCFKMIKQCVRAMVKARFGRIVNISSVVGFTGNIGQANYTAAKAGLIGMSKSMAIEVGRYGVTINNVAPGFVDTDMTRDLPQENKDKMLAQIPMQKMAEPQDIADAVAFFASEQAKYITGETLHVNGGMYMG